MLRTAGAIVNFLYRNKGDGTFERDLQSLPNFSTPCSFGTAWSDLNKDGFQDLVISTCKNGQNDPEPNNLLFMNQGNKNTWVEIHLSGRKSNRAAIGAKLRVKSTINGKSVWQILNGLFGVFAMPYVKRKTADETTADTAAEQVKQS